MPELSCGMTPEEIEAEAAEAERETQQVMANHLAERGVALKAMTKDQRYYALHRPKRLADSAKDRADKVTATPPWLSAKQKKAITAVYQLAVDLGEATGIPHAVDHVVPLVGFCRKTRRATGERKQVVCGLHVPWNLRSIPLSINRNIKGEWFDSDWPVEVDPNYLRDEDIPF